MIPDVIFSMSFVPSVFIPITYWSNQLRLGHSERILKPDERKKLDDKILAVAAKMEVNKKLELVEMWNDGSAQGIGGTLLLGKAGVGINPNFLTDESITEDMLGFILAHEIAHIKHNDYLRIPLIVGIITACATVILRAGSSKLCEVASGSSVSYAAIISLLVSPIIAFPPILRWSEKKADEKAFSVCSQKETDAFIKFLEIFQEKYKSSTSYLSFLWQRHPHPKDRIDYLRNLP